MADFSNNKEVLEMMRALDPEERAKMYQEYSARGIQLPSDQDEFDAVTSSPLFQQLDDDSRKKLYSSYGRTYAAPQGAAMDKSLLPGLVSDASAAAGGALSGFRGGRLPGAALGAVGGFLANRGVQKATGTEPEGATAANLLSLNPFGKGAMVNAALRGGESMAGAFLDNRVKQYELQKAAEQDPARGQRLANSPANTSAEPLTAGLMGAVGGGVMGGLGNAAGSQYARRVAANQGVQEGLEGAGSRLKTGPDVQEIARQLLESKGLITKGQSAGPKVEPFGSDTNLPNALSSVSGKKIPNPDDAPLPPTTGKMPLYPDAANSDIPAVSKQVGQTLTKDLPRKQIAEIQKRTGFDIKQITPEDWKTLRRYAQKNPEDIYSEVLSPLFEAKSKDALPAAAKQMQNNLETLSAVMGKTAPDIKKGLGKTFIARLIEESGDGKFANPESLLLRMEQIGPKTFDALLDSPGAFSKFKDLAKMAESQKLGAKGQMMALTKWGAIIKIMSDKSPTLGKDKERLVALPWDKLIEKFANKKTVNLLSPGNQRFTRRAVDFEAEEASESGEPLVPRL